MVSMRRKEKLRSNTSRTCSNLNLKQNRSGMLKDFKKTNKDLLNIKKKKLRELKKENRL